MNSDHNLRDYLWDPEAPPDADVAAIERRLSSVRFDPGAAALDVTRLGVEAATKTRRWRRPVAVMALAASLLIAAGAGVWAWRWSWPEGRAWTVRADSFDSRLEVGRQLTLPQGGGAIANIGRIGTMRLGGGTALELRSTRGTRHRLRMLEGQMHVRVWAPPASIVVETPAGEVIDMGCEFLLTVTGSTTTVRVLSGWVQIENGIDEVQIPAGASSDMNSTVAPAVPVFDDAAEAFREAARRVERELEAGPVDRMLHMARARDVYTLLIFADRYPALAPRILARASELSPPPGDVTLGRILRGDREALWKWSNSLPLPPPKSGWWKNWRDALPLR